MDNECDGPTTSFNYCGSSLFRRLSLVLPSFMSLSSFRGEVFMWLAVFGYSLPMHSSLSLEGLPWIRDIFSNKFLGLSLSLRAFPLSRVSCVGAMVWANFLFCGSTRWYRSDKWFGRPFLSVSLGGFNDNGGFIPLLYVSLLKNKMGRDWPLRFVFVRPSITWCAWYCILGWVG